MGYKVFIFSILVLSLGMIGCAEDEESSTALTITGATASSTSSLAVNATSVRIKVFKVELATSGDCSSPTTVFSTDSPSYVEMTTSPTLGSGDLADGVYNCVIITMSDTIKFTPAATEGDCAAGTELTRDVCSGGGTFTDANGNTATCDATEQNFKIFISTFSTDSGAGNSNPFVAPTAANDSTRGFNLASAFAKSGSVSKSFIVNFNGKIEDNDGAGGDSCDLQPPIWGFE